MRLKAVDIDASGSASDAIKKYVRQSQFGGILYPSFGRGITAAQMPISQWQQSKGKHEGPEWVRTKGKPGDPPGIMFDTNYWKTRFHRALAQPSGSQGAIYLYKVDDPADHRLVSEHWYGEKATEVTAGNRVVIQFTQRPGSDIHYFDSGVGNMVAASREGVSSVVVNSKRKTIDLAALQRERWEKAGKRV
jgi:hypothetical protein